MEQLTVVVEGFLAAEPRQLNLRDEMWPYALDQRAFGPRRLLVGFADADGTLRSLAHTRRTDPPEAALEPCILHLGQGAALAVAWCDEPVALGRPPTFVAPRFLYARAVAARYGIDLVDWIACDDDVFRSARLSVIPDDPWPW